MSKMYDGHLKGVAFLKYSDFIILQLSPLLKGLAQAKIIKKSVILFRVLNMTI